MSRRRPVAAGSNGGEPGAERGSDGRTRRGLLGALAGATTGLLAGCLGGSAAADAGGTVEGRWPQHRGGVENTGATTDRGPKASASPAWTVDLDGGVEAAPVVADGTVYVATTAGSVHALSAATGDHEWTAAVGDRIRSSPAVSGDSVFVGADTDDGAVLASLDRATGDRNWRRRAGTRVSPPTVTDSTVYAGIRRPDGGRSAVGAVAVDADTGDEQWTHLAPAPTHGGPVAQPTVADAPTGERTVHVRGANGYALDPDTGAVRAAHAADATGGATTAAAGDALYVAGRRDADHAGGELQGDEVGGEVGAIDPGSGDRRWSFATDAPVEAAPAVAPGRRGSVFAVDADGTAYAVDAADGTERWRSGTAGPGASAPALAGETVYVGTDAGHLVALDATSGEKRWTFAAGAGPLTAPAVVDGVVFVAGEGGRVYALA